MKSTTKATQTTIEKIFKLMETIDSSKNNNLFVEVLFCSDSSGRINNLNSGSIDFRCIEECLKILEEKVKLIENTSDN